MRRVSVKLKKKHPVLRGFGVALAVFLAVVLVLEIGVFANHLSNKQTSNQNPLCLFYYCL